MVSATFSEPTAPLWPLPSASWWHREVQGWRALTIADPQFQKTANEQAFVRLGACRRGRLPQSLEITVQPWLAIAAKSVVTGTLVDMDQTFLSLIIGILLALALGFLLGWVLRGRASPAGSGDESLVLRTQLEMVQGQLESMKADQDLSLIHI